MKMVHLQLDRLLYVAYMYPDELALYRKIKPDYIVIRKVTDV